MRNGELILKYFGRNYLRIGSNYMDLKQWNDAIKCFAKIKDINRKEVLTKKLLFRRWKKSLIVI